MQQIDKKTKWECVRCGDCCKGYIPEKKKNLAINNICKFLDNNECNNYQERPFICKLYPFIIDLDNILSPDGVARPQNAFLLENLKIHEECPGIGQGKRIYANKNLQKKLDKISYEFAVKFKTSFEKKIDIEELL